MICERCKKETDVHVMSFFNTQEICLECEDEEREHPDFKSAYQAEVKACQRGNFNFPGIGWPGENGRIA